MKKDVNREHLKNNFLKNIIVRFDYTGIAEVELDTIIAEVKPIFKSAGYTKLTYCAISNKTFKNL